MPHSATEIALRSHLRSHNSTVLMAAVMALLFSTIGWVLLYGMAYWVTMFSLTVAHMEPGGMPPTFNVVFFSSVGVLMLAAWVDQLLFPGERALDQRPPLEHFADILFFVPRFTLSCWQSLAALVRLPPANLQQATQLIDLLNACEKVSLQELPALLPDPDRLHKTLTALNVANVIAQRNDHGFIWIHFSPLAPESLRHPPTAETESRQDHLDSMPRARTVEPRPSLLPPDRVQ